MSKEYDSSLRAQGGNGYIDAMFRYGVHPRQYAERIFIRVVEKMEKEKQFSFYSTKRFFIITKEGVPLIIQDYDFVELKRQEGTYAYDQWVEDIVEGK
ncbi:MAG: hypothetical protein JXQ26_00855 [Tissierellales bacterium]|nr:hypothetical protein [Tissierellales bacterium]MBN2826506.1 hypothetical protein [Tissierellales bacterium]